MAPLRILISNDDGIFADGIKALALAAATRGHQVAVVCPDKERSATGHGITLQHPIRAERADQLFGQGITAWACSGTPADCVKLAICELLETPPDLVLSGINHGPNLGTDIFCSGTVAAALEGTLEGRPAMAVSSACFKWREFEGAAVLAMDTAESALREGWPSNLLLNLNLPPCKPETMGPMRWTRLSIRRYREQFSPRTDPQGRSYYWLAGKLVEDLKSGGDGPRDWPTDVAQIGSNSPSLTPIEPELFWRGSLSGLPQVEIDGQRVR